MPWIPMGDTFPMRFFGKFVFWRPKTRILGFSRIASGASVGFLGFQGLYVYFGPKQMCLVNGAEKSRRHPVLRPIRRFRTCRTFYVFSREGLRDPHFQSWAVICVQWDSCLSQKIFSHPPGSPWARDTGFRKNAFRAGEVTRRWVFCGSEIFFIICIKNGIFYMLEP